ncbi:MAG: DUF3488 and DUF4129 domain-containing transglutaminase family protein [Bryobacteraceae bacterium]
MARSAANPAVPRTSLNRFFEFALLGLLTSGYLAVAGSGSLDLPTILVAGLALFARGLHTAGLIRIELSPRLVTAVTACYIAFYPIDYAFISEGFLPATVHLIFFLAVMKVLGARTNRDYFFLTILAFLEILAASVLSVSLNFVFFLACFLVFAVATFASFEMRRSAARAGVVSRPGQRGVYGRLTALTAFTTLGILLMTAVLFFLLPRTARAAFRHLVPERYHLSGFSNEVTLGEIGEIKRHNTPVMRVHFYAATQPPSLKWRGTALAEFDGRRWFNSSHAGQKLESRSGQFTLDSHSQSWRLGRRVGYEVHLRPIASDTLFFAGIPEFLQISAPLLIRTPVDGYRLGYTSVDGVRYSVYSFLPEEDRSAPLTKADGLVVPELSAEQKELYLRLPRLDPRIAELSTGVAPGASDARRAEAIEELLATRFGYTTELLRQEVEDPIAHFLFTRRKGHCEYFASAMAVMLRTQGIPARVVTGFQSGIYNPLSGWVVVRAADAHSWVEAYLSGRGWTTFDPTPPDPDGDVVTLWSKMLLYVDAAETFWQEWVVNYDLDRQLNLAEKLEASRRKAGWLWMERLSRAAAEFKEGVVATVRDSGLVMLGWTLAAILAMASAPLLWVRWVAMRRAERVRRGEVSATDATVLYRGMLRLLEKRGIAKPAWMTPTEFVRVMPRSETAELVQEVTAAYNDLRYGHDPAAGPRLMGLLRQLEQHLQQGTGAASVRQPA